MGFANYTELRAEVKGWLMDRDDLVAKIPSFITLAEADLNDRIRHRKMVKRSRLAGVTTSRIPLPEDWLEARNVELYLGDRPSRLDYTSDENLDEIRDRASGTLTPTHYAIVGDELELIPAPSSVTIEMIYYAAIPSLVVTPSNWLLVARPDAYLYGTLMHSAPYLEDDARVGVWSAGYERAVTTLNNADRVARTSGGPLKRRLRSYG
jgi:hypothetical protein